MLARPLDAAKRSKERRSQSAVSSSVPQPRDKPPLMLID
jgi:hypothetical protein